MKFNKLSDFETLDRLMDRKAWEDLTKFLPINLSDPELNLLRQFLAEKISRFNFFWTAFVFVIVFFLIQLPIAFHFEYLLYGRATQNPIDNGEGVIGIAFFIVCGLMLFNMPRVTIALLAVNARPEDLSILISARTPARQVPAIYRIVLKCLEVHLKLSQDGQEQLSEKTRVDLLDWIIYGRVRSKQQLYLQIVQVASLEPSAKVLAKLKRMRSNPFSILYTKALRDQFDLSIAKLSGMGGVSEIPRMRY